MKQKVGLLLVLFFYISTIAIFSQTVYITKTGKKYHAESCRYLSKSKIALSLTDAVIKHYMPCSICKPPVISSQSNKSTGTSQTKTNSVNKTSNSFSAGKTIYTGPRGGHYYYNSKGHKTYVRKRK